MGYPPRSPHSQHCPTAIFLSASTISNKKKPSPSTDLLRLAPCLAPRLVPCLVRVKSKFSAYNFKKIRIPQFSETRFGSFVGLFSCFYVYKQ